MTKTKNSVPGYMSLLRECERLQKEVETLKRQHAIDLSEIVTLRRQMERMEHDSQRKKD